MTVKEPIIVNTNSAFLPMLSPIRRADISIVKPAIPV
jgi:hypothetical protein